MRLALALLLAVLFTPPSIAPADAASRWCAIYGGGNGGRNCGFSTLKQCRAAISGDNTGTCLRSAYSGRKARRR